MFRNTGFGFLLLAVASFTTSIAALTQEERWVRIDRTADLVLYVDRLRARVIDSTTVEVWTSWEFTTQQTLVDKKFNKMVALNRLDCKATRSSQIEGNFYLDNQFQVHVATPVELLEWTNAPPQSINETLVTRGCLIARRQPTEPVK
jgi:hypothetical protein